MESPALAQLGRFVHALAQFVARHTVQAVRHYFEPGDVYQPRHAYVAKQLEQQPKPIELGAEHSREFARNKHIAQLTSNIDRLDNLAAIVRRTIDQLDGISASYAFPVTWRPSDAEHADAGYFHRIV